MSIKVNENLPTLNTSLLSDIILWAGRDKAKIDKAFIGWGDWEQSSWAKEIRNGICKSSYCIAGQAAVQSGYALDLHSDIRMSDGSVQWSADRCYPGIPIKQEDGKTVIAPDTSADSERIEEVGVRVLGLDYDSSEDVLFSGDNDFAAVVTLASYFARRRGTTLDLPAEIESYDLRIDDDQYETFLDEQSFDVEDDDY